MRHLFLIALIAILTSGFFFTLTIPLNHIVESGVDDFSEVNEDAIAEQIEIVLRCQFFENIGQKKNPNVRFYGNIPGGVIGFAVSKILLWMEGADGVVTMSFEGALDVLPVGVGEVSHRTNYILGSSGTYTNIRGFSTVVYEDLWSGIDLVYKGTTNGAKYEFRVTPDADPADIQVRYEGQDSIVIGRNSLRLEKGNGILTDEDLRVFQGVTDVEGEFISLGDDVFGFSVGDYDTFKTLIIDPLLYSTYVSGSDSDNGYEIAVDSSGNAYVTGYTQSTDFPTLNAYNTTGDGSTDTTDVFVFKLSSDGSSLLYSTYVGGSHTDIGYGIAVDSSGNAYVTGYTQSTDFPTLNAYNATGDGSIAEDVFVFKLSSDGSSLLYSTYVGGSYHDRGKGIAVDSLENVYVTGHTDSTDFPTVNAYNATGDGDTLKLDVFVFKLSSDGSSLLYSTYVSGSADDRGTGIAIDGLGNTYVTGWTLSTDFPSVSAYDSIGDVEADIFVFKLSSDGSSLLYATYVGGSYIDLGQGIAVDSSGNAYVTGETYSTDFPTVNAYNTTGDGSTDTIDVFVFKLSSDGSSLLYSTYVSGSHTEIGHGIAVDSSGNAYVTGETRSTDFPIVNAYEMTEDDRTLFFDVFVFKLSSNGSRLSYSTCVGGSRNEIGYGIAVDSLGNVYVTGRTSSVNFPTVNAFAVTGDGSTSYNDVFVFKLGDNIAPEINTPFDLTYEIDTAGNQITWIVGDMAPNTYRVDGNGSTVDWTEWSNGSISVNVDGLSVGVFNYTITVMDAFENQATDTVFVVVIEDETTPSIDHPADITYSVGEIVNAITWNPSDLHPATYEILRNGSRTEFGVWDGSSITIDVNDLSGGVYNYTLVVSDSQGNWASDTVLVIVTSAQVDFDPVMTIVLAGGGLGIFAILAVVFLLKRKPRPSEAVPADPKIKVLRGCEAVGDTYEYKVKIQNDTDYVINKVTVTIVSYPEDCMRIDGDRSKAIAMIEPSGFRSPQFIFTPTKDCVEGSIQATVSYIDHENQLRMTQSEPYTIRSVCDLLQPLKRTLDEFEELLYEMSADVKEIIVQRAPEDVFAKTQMTLPERNFHIIETQSDSVEGKFTGTIRCLAIGKYTKKKLAIRIVVSGLAGGSKSSVLIEALGDDNVMLPITISEIAEMLSD